MKKLNTSTLAIGMLLVLSLQTSAQQLKDKYILSFSTPDVPAFKALGTEPSKLLKPSDIKKISFLTSLYDNLSKGGFPDEFGIEISPGRIRSKHWTLSEYDSSCWKKLLYQTSFSMGTDINDSEGRSSVAIGLRFSFSQEEGNPLRDSNFRNRNGAFLAKLAAQTAQIKSSFLSANGLPPAAIMPSHLQDEYEAYKKKQENLSQTETARKAFLETYEDKHWNRRTLDIAAAILYTSPDTTITSLKFSKTNLWLTLSLPGMPKSCNLSDKAQFLAGLVFEYHGKLPYQEEATEITIPLRYTAGTKNHQGFLELQHSYVNLPSQSNSGTLAGMLNIGTEHHLIGNFWIQFQAGIEDLYDPKKGPLKDQLLASFDIEYGFGKNRKN